MLSRLALPLALVMLAASPAVAQVGDSATPAKTGDARIKTLLDKLNLKYKVTDQGNFRLVFKIGDKRSQLVFINSETSKYDDIEVREVWSPAYECKGLIPEKTANYLLEESDKYKIGGWTSIKLDDGGRRVIFNAKTAANPSSDTLGSVLEAVANSADEVEKELTDGKDDY